MFNAFLKQVGKKRMLLHCNRVRYKAFLGESGEEVVEENAMRHCQQISMKLLKWHKREIALRQRLRGGESGGNK